MSNYSSVTDFSLTVEEHLYFYSSLKGMRKQAQEEEMKKMIEDVGLPHKRLALASSLSGRNFIMFLDYRCKL